MKEAEEEYVELKAKKKKKVKKETKKEGFDFDISEGTERVKKYFDDVKKDLKKMTEEIK